MDVTVGSTVVAPGASTTVTLKLQTTAACPVMALVELKTNDPASPLAYLTVEGTAPQGVTVLPEWVLFRASKGSLTGPKVVVTGPAGMRLGDVLCLAERFTPRVTGPDKDERASHWVIELTLKPDAVGAIQDELEIHTSDLQRRLITVPISATIAGDLQAEPDGLFWGFVPPNEAAEQKLTLRSRSGASFHVAEARALDERVEVGGPRQTSPSSWEMMVRLGTQRPGVVDSKLVLTTDVPGETTIEVRVYGDTRARP